jgi:hypothetical protein
MLGNAEVVFPPNRRGREACRMGSKHDKLQKEKLDGRTCFVACWVLEGGMALDCWESGQLGQL